MKVLAIDPGNEYSAWLRLEQFSHEGKITSSKIIDFGKYPNEDMPSILRTTYADHLAIEMVASYGMAVGKTIFDTVFWSGRFAEAWKYVQRKPFHLVYRKDVKMHLCNSMRAKDANIRQALIDRFGPPGTKKAPGGTYGISRDAWSALGIAVTFADTFAQA